MTRYTNHVADADHHIHHSFLICFKTDIVFPAQAEYYYYYYFSFNFRLKISMWLFLDHSVWQEVLRKAFPFYWLWWCWSIICWRLHVLKPEMTHMTSCRNVISLEHTENAAFVIFGYCGLEEGRMLYGLYLVKNDIGFTNFQHTKLYPFQNLRLGFILKVFFRKC